MSLFSSIMYSIFVDFNKSSSQKKKTKKKRTFLRVAGTVVRTDTEPNEIFEVNVGFHQGSVVMGFDVDSSENEVIYPPN